MKRWIIFLGRVGTVFLVIGLAMFLVALIPAAQTGRFGGGMIVAPESFEWSPSFSLMLTPQQSLRVTVEANTTVTVYFLDVNATYLAEQTQGNSSKLAQFLETNSDVALWQKEIFDGRAELEEYVPTKIVSLLLVYSNRGTETASITYEVGISSLIAPGKRVLKPAQWLIPVGIMLAVPWLILSKTKKV